MSEKLIIRDFDPFAALPPLFRRLRNVNSWLVGLPIAVILAGLVVGACAISGTLGVAKDFQPGQDLRRVFGIDHPPASPPSMPLIRDITSWYLAFVVVATCIIVHRQWQRMGRCLSDLAENDVLLPKGRIERNRVFRLLRLNRYVDRGMPATALDSFIGRVNELVMLRISKWAPVISGIAALLVISLIIGEKQGLVHVLEPEHLSAAGRQQWLTKTYESWWASFNHPLGLVVYFLAAFLGAYVIVLQNLIGVTAVYAVVALSTLIEFDADWLNRDGHYGWKPLDRIFRTVYLSLSLHGLTISVLLVVLGLQNFPWIAGLVAIWVVVVPLYIFVPWILFRRLEARVRQRRMASLSRLSSGLSLNPGIDFDQVSAVISEIERVRKARIRPIRLLVPEIATFGIAVLLPLILTAAQIWFSIGFGPSKGLGH